LRRYKAKRVKTRCYHEGVGQFQAIFQLEGVIAGEYFLTSKKIDTFCYLKRKLHGARFSRFEAITFVFNVIKFLFKLFFFLLLFHYCATIYGEIKVFNTGV